VQLIDDRRLPDAGMSRDEHQPRCAAGDDLVEGGEQRSDLALASVQSLWHEQPIGAVLLAQRKLVDGVSGLPVMQAAPKVALEAHSSLVSLLRCLGEQLHDDRGDGGGDLLEPCPRWRRLSRDVAVHPLHRVAGGEGEASGEDLVERDPQ